MFDLSPVLSVSWDEALELLKPLALFIAVIAAFCIFVFIFSGFVARRDFFGAGGKYEELTENLRKSPIVTAIEYLLFFPILVFFWSAVFFVMLIFLAPPNQPLETTLAVALATVGVIRITAYFSEGYADEMAKLVPLTILVIFMLDVQLFSFWSSVNVIKEAVANPVLWKTGFYSLVFIIVMEFFLRSVYTIVRIIAEARRKSVETDLRHDAARIAGEKHCEGAWAEEEKRGRETRPEREK